MASQVLLTPIAKLDEKWVFADFFLSCGNALIPFKSNVTTYDYEHKMSNAKKSPQQSSSTIESNICEKYNNESTSNVVNINNDENSKSKSNRKKSKKRNKKVTKRVDFSDVEISFFSREIAYSSVPSSGSWPLGMSLLRESVHIYKINEYEENILKEKQLRHQSSHIHNHNTSEKDELDTIELNTRISIFSNVVEDLNVQTINHEVDMIQKSRKLNDKGCNCKPLKFDKLSVPKLKCELLKAGYTDTSFSNLNKTQLTKKLKDHLKGKSCSICIDITCPCVMEELGCNASICECLKKATKTETSCINPFGTVICDPVRVQTYRQKYLVNQPMKTDSTIKALHSKN